MQLDIEIIDAFMGLSRYLAGGLGDIDEHPNLFVGEDKIHNTEYHLTKDELIIPYGSGFIAFGEPYPSKILSLDIGDPVVIREQVVSIALKTWHNAKSTPFSYTRKITDEHIIKEILNIATELMLGIRSKVAGEYAGIKAELETQLTAKLGISHTSEEQHRVMDESEVTIDVPAWTSVSLTQKESTSDFQQSINMKCLLDASLRINHGQEKHFASLGEFALYMKGGGGGDGESWIDTYANQRRFTNFEVPELCFDIHRQRMYKDAKTSDWTTTELPIEH